MCRKKFIASCSGGKDSVATLIVAAENNEPLDEVVYSEVMFDRNVSGEVPEHRDFIYDVLEPFCERKLGVPFTILHSKKTYEDVFHHIMVRGSHRGMLRGFAWPGICTVNRDCKIPPITKYIKGLSANVISYVGIAADEPIRLARLDGTNKVSLLEKYGVTEEDARKMCEGQGLLSPIYDRCNRNGCWFCPNAKDAEWRHILINHPALFDRIIQWEQEENVFHRRITRTETPSELKMRLLPSASVGFCVS